MANPEFSKYERARILGARGLQISMDAPLLLKMDNESMTNLNFDPLNLAEAELNSGVLPISVKRPMPEKHEKKLKAITIPKESVSDEKKKQDELNEEKEIVDGGEIMELVTDTEETEEEYSAGDSEDKEELE